MIVVADTSPLNYLILIDHIDVLPSLYGRVLIPHAVLQELLSPFAPLPVSTWAHNPPEWLELLSLSLKSDALTPMLDPGEAEAILLAEQLSANWLLMDEVAGRQEAQRRGLQPIGTLGILREAHRTHLLDFAAATTRLKATTFRVSQALIDRLADDL